MTIFDSISLVFVFMFCYFIGAIPFGLIVTKYAGLGDIRNIGSGNIGATNVLRTGRKGLAALTLLLDGLKGAVAVYLGTHVLMPAHLAEFKDNYIAVSSLAVVLGHIFPVWLKFKGGKGVATTFGAFAMINPIWALMLFIIWMGMAFSFQYSSLSALVATFIAPFIGKYVFDFSGTVFISTCIIAAIVIIKHKSNIQRLLNGTESKINLKKKSAPRQDNQDDGTGVPL
ncbi:MAG: glycerol-3-phosphate 1-O-acyltransferase [Alphaproteobacteria bacterium]|nr:MAG: glycerol-3-phosphate 1-O-acyltransferase [Alphaproteobacteria bacterium]